MADFSDQYHHPFLIDSTFLPNIINTDPPPHEFHFHQESSFVDQSSKIDISDNNEPSSVIKNQSPETSMVVDNKLENGDQVTEKVTPMDKNKKRRTRIESSSLTSPQSKDSSSEGRNKKQRKSNGGEKEKYKPKAEKKEQKNGPQEPPTGYIHVRARRGQATDSHSLAERVRREKISERMKLLQKLVPGCDKVQEVTGKALVLDEIINYVQSLQNQVEFLSMKLASVNPMFYDSAMDIDNLLVRPEKFYGIASPPPFMLQCSSNLNEATTSADTTSFPAANDYHLLDNSSSVFLQEQRSSNVFSEDAGTMFWDLEDQRQKFLHAYGFGNSFCSLH